MTPAREDHSGPDRGLRPLLEDLESLLRESTPSAPQEGPRLVHALEALDEACAEDPRGAERLARRIARARALVALRMREVPDEALDGLYESVRAHTIEAEAGDLAWRRAGMSRAFLDAPQTLARWRSLAVAACALIAVGVGLVVTRQVDVVDPTSQPTAAQPGSAGDPRDEILSRWKSAGAEASPDSPWQPWVRSANMPSRRASPSPSTFTFTVRPRRDWNAGRLLDVVPIPGAPARRNDLEKN